MRKARVATPDPGLVTAVGDEAGVSLACPRLVYLELAAAEVLAVECLGSPRGVGARHLDETEAAGAPGVAIADERE